MGEAIIQSDVARLFGGEYFLCCLTCIKLFGVFTTLCVSHFKMAGNCIGDFGHPCQKVALGLQKASSGPHAVLAVQD